MARTYRELTRVNDQKHENVQAQLAEELECTLAQQVGVWCGGSAATIHISHNLRQKLIFQTLSCPTHFKRQAVS